MSESSATSPAPLGLEPLLRALDDAEDGIAIYTVEDWAIASTVVYANRALEELSGYAREHFVGHSALLLAGARPDAATLASILPPHGEHALRARSRKRRPDGSAYEVDVEVLPLRDVAGQVTHYLSLQRMLPQARSARIPHEDGVHDRAFLELAAGVAYEFDALTSRCLSGLAKAIVAAGPDAEARPAILAARAAAESMASTVRGLRSFTVAPEDEDQNSGIDVHEALELALRLSGPAVRERAMIERRYAPTARVRGTVRSLAPVFAQILRNAGEAIPAGSPHANHITVETRHDLRGRVSVVVSDTGVGVEAGDVPYVFDPFFTTKPSPETGGLGLAGARAVLAQLGGDVIVTSVLGQGTRVTVTLAPSDDARVRTVAPCLVTREAPTSRLLSVADSRERAHDLGGPFTDDDLTLAATTWSEAWERLALGERFDLVVYDGRSSRAEAFRAKLRQLAPDMRSPAFELSIAASPVQSGFFAKTAPEEGDPDAEDWIKVAE